MLHGKGKQNILSKATEEDRLQAMRDNEGYSADDLITLEITGSLGGGSTNEQSFVIKQNPFPIDPTIKPKQKLDFRKVQPQLGEMSD